MGSTAHTPTLPLATLAHVGEPGEVVGRGGEELKCCVLPRQLDRPTTPRGEAGGWGWGDVAWSALARCGPSTPPWGEGWGWAGGNIYLYSIGKKKRAGGLKFHVELLKIVYFSRWKC